MTWRLLQFVAIVCLAAAAQWQQSTAVASDSFQCTRAEYCDATCDGTNDTLIPMAGSLTSLMGNSSGERQLHASVVRMVRTVETQFGPVGNDVENGLHLSFQYLCCYNRTELEQIEAAMKTVRWQPIEVRFTRVVCAASMVLGLADPHAQGQLFAVVSAIEEAMEAAGVRVRQRFRAEQAPFHASLFTATPNHTSASTAEVVAAAQSTITGGSLNADPIVVDSFTFNGQTFTAEKAAIGKF